MAGQPARPERLSGRGWPKLRPAWSTAWRCKRPLGRQLAEVRASVFRTQALGQLLHRKVFKPVQREVEGRKDLEKRLADRKKVP